MKLDKEIEPLQADTTLLVRPRSALGLKYVELTPGDAAGGLRRPARRSRCAQARPAVVEIDELLQHVRRRRPGVGSRNSLNGFGGGLAGRGRDLNTAIGALRPAAQGPRAGGAPTWPAPETQTRPLLQGARRRGRRGGAGGRDAGRAVREPGHHLHRARLDRAAVPAGDRSPRARRARSWRSASSRSSARSCATTRPSSASCGRASPRCRTPRRSWRTPSRPAPRRCPRRRRSTGSWPTCSKPWPSSPRTRSCARACSQLTRLSSLAEADAGLPDAGADHLQLRDAVLPQRRQRALRRRRQRHLAALHHHRRRRGTGPNNEGGPSRAPANGPEERQLPRTPTRIRTRPRPARRRSARPATSATRQRRRDRDRQRARQPGHQDRRTSPRPGRASHEAGRTAADDRRCSAGLIAIVLILVVAYLGFTKDIPFTRPYELQAVFQNAPPIADQHSPVRIAGVEVGKVVEGRAAAAATRRACKVDDEAQGRGAADPHGRRRSRSASASSSRATSS